MTLTTLSGVPGGAQLDHLPELSARLAERAGEHDREATFPFEGVQAVHEAGLLTATVAARYGGPGVGLAGTTTILRELGKGDPSVALVTAMTLFAHAGQAREPGWPEAHYAQLLAESRTGPALVNALRVEPELGTPARGGLPATVARGTPEGWELSGHKIFSTGAVALAWMLVWAATDEDPVRVGSFLVRRGAPGVHIEPTWDHLGLRASRSDDVVLTGVPVPRDAVVGLAEPRPGPGRAPELMAWNSLGLASIYVGVAEAARDWLVGFLHERVPSGLGKPLATLPRFVSGVGEIEAALVGARDLLTGLATRVDAGDPEAVAHAGIGKLVATRAAIGAVEQAVALVGNNGLTRHNPLQRHLRDVLCARVHTPQDDSILTAAGQAALSTAAGQAALGTAAGQAALSTAAGQAALTRTSRK